MALAMGANLLYRTAYMNAAVTINHEMITYAAQSALAVSAVNIRYGEVATFLGRTAMNDDFLYLTHDIDFSDDWKRDKYLSGITSKPQSLIMSVMRSLFLIASSTFSQNSEKYSSE